MKKEHLIVTWPGNNGTVFAGHCGTGRGHSIHRPRGTNDWQLIATTYGCGRIGSTSGSFTVGVGDLVLMRPGVLHDYGPEEPGWEYDWVHFQPRQEWLDLLTWPEHAPGLMRLRLSDPTLRSRVMGALARTLEGYPFHRRQLFLINALEEALLLCDMQNPLSRNRGLDPRLSRVIAYLGKNLTNKVTLAMLADLAGISVSRLSHLFHEQIGMGPMQYLDLQRLEYARFLLENSDTPITRIAAEVGLDVRYFSVRFKQHTTISPSAYRKRAVSPPSPIVSGLI